MTITPEQAARRAADGLAPQRDPGRIAPILADLARYWHAHPDMRLGQIVVSAIGAHGVPDVFYPEDDRPAAWLAEAAADCPPAPDLRALVEEYGAAECTHGVAVASGPLDMPAPDEEAKVNATKAALLVAIDRALGRTAAPQAERVPCAGWVRVAPNRWHLTVGHLRATVYVSTTGVSWRVAVMLDGEHILSSSEVDDHTATSVAPAQLAAEDAIAELCTAGLRAIGR